MRRTLEPKEYLLPSGDLYLDNAAYRPMTSAVQAEWLRWAHDFQANPASSHRAGRQAQKEWETKLEELAEFFGVQPRNCIAVSGSTEAINTYLKSFLFIDSSRKVFVCPENEHPATLKTLEWMANYGFETKPGLLNTSGFCEEDSILDLLNEDVACVVLSKVNGETGYVSDISRIGDRCNQLGIQLFIDATQTVGKFEMDDVVKYASGFCFSSSKIGAGTGAGFLILLDNFPLQTLMAGGGHQANRRSGTLNLSSMLCTVTALNELQNIAPPALQEINAFMQVIFNMSFEFESMQNHGSNTWIHLVGLPYDEADLHSNIPWLAISNGSACSSSTLTSPKSYELLNTRSNQLYRLSL
jgi:cysteine desulfurase